MVCNLYQLKVAIHLDPPDSTLELGYTSFRGAGQDPVAVLAHMDGVDSQKPLLSLETPWGLRRAPICKGIAEWLKVSGSEGSEDRTSTASGGSADESKSSCFLVDPRKEGTRRIFSFNYFRW